MSTGDDLQLNGDLACQNAEIRGQLAASSLLVGGVPITAGANPLIDLSVNNASADLGFAGTAVLRTGGSANPAGAFNGGGTGNKTFLGVRGYSGSPLSAVQSIELTWRNLLGPTGPFFVPPGAGTVVTPYVNFVVDFAPLVPGGDLRVLLLISDSLMPAITTAIGTYLNPGGLNTLVYGWTELMNVCIVASPPNAVPGGVVPSVSVGPSFLDNAYSWAALKAANPTAVFVDAFPAPTFAPTGDGGAPAGAILPAIVVVSGDSGNVTKSGKHLVALKINGTALQL